jgi:hypothetical protein
MKVPCNIFLIYTVQIDVYATENIELVNLHAMAMAHDCNVATRPYLVHVWAMLTKSSMAHGDVWYRVQIYMCSSTNKSRTLV